MVESQERRWRALCQGALKEFGVVRIASSREVNRVMSKISTLWYSFLSVESCLKCFLTSIKSLFWAKVSHVKFSLDVLSLPWA